jgi:hypothetical protein
LASSRPLFLSIGVHGWLLVEAKSFEFVVDEEVSILQIFERSKGILRTVFLGKTSGSWLETVKDLLQAEGQKVFAKKFRFSSRAFLAQRGSNKRMCFLALVEYEGGSWKGYLVIPEGREGKGEGGFAYQLHNAMELLSFAGVGSGESDQKKGSSLLHRRNGKW